MEFPLWATPERRARLVELSQRRCALGDEPCPVWETLLQAIVAKLGQPDAGDSTWPLRAALLIARLTQEMPLADRFHIPPWATRELIALWKEDDRLERSIARKIEKRRLHAAPQIRVRGPFDSIRREIYLAQRPIFKIVAIGVGAFTQHRVAKVVIPGLKATLWVDISDTALGASKNKLRKAVRYGKGAVPKDKASLIEERITSAVKRYL